MGFFDRFRSKKATIGKERAPKHVVVDAKKNAEKKNDAHATFRTATALQTPAREGGQAKRTKVVREDTRRAYRVLLRPVVTEKSSALGTRGQYVFAVDESANKIEVRKAIQAVYGVLPRSVTVRRYEGKRVRYGRTHGQTRGWKKAIVTLASGQKIDVTEG